MFFKNSLHPAAAVASASPAMGSNRGNHPDSMYIHMDEADDFNAFLSGSGRGNMSKTPERPQPQHRPPKKKKPFNPKMILIGVAAVVVVALAVLLILLAVLSAGSKDMKYENNSYLVYTDEKDEYHVLVNGDELEEDFEGEVALYPSADRSFAYVVESGDEGIQVYLLDGKELKKVTPSPVDEVYAFAQLKPGVIYRLNNSFRIYSDENGEQPLAKQKDNPKNFIISGDASTVIYSATEDKGETKADYLYIYSDGASRRTVKNCYPVAISNYADYIYGYMTAEGQDDKELYYIDPDDFENPVKIKNNSGFDSEQEITLNVKGDEILYYISNGSEHTTMLYRAKKDESIAIGAGILKPAKVDPDVAIYGSFKDTYLMGLNSSNDSSAYSTYYIGKDYKGDQIAKFKGQFSPDGDYFYYINNNGSLMQMDLKDENHARKNTNHEDIIDFAITEKGNLYTLDDDHLLRFYKVSTGRSDSLSYEANLISIYNYANTIYFSEEETENVNVWISEEGSTKEEAKMDKIQITEIPFFSNPAGKKTYAYYYDSESGSWHLYYTGNGKSFDLISNQCNTIFVDGVEITND